eukprot:GFKZ01012156.1.p1 GENE.GFKZ01012156.1~~GFKZ01012156.1.p1  ORF type:complete len:104 (-),score=5.46 GFKZ01012156.1:58-369(-)
MPRLQQESSAESGISCLNATLETQFCYSMNKTWVPSKIAANAQLKNVLKLSSRPMLFQVELESTYHRLGISDTVDLSPPPAISHMYGLRKASNGDESRRSSVS